MGIMNRKQQEAIKKQQEDQEKIMKLQEENNRVSMALVDKISELNKTMIELGTMKKEVNEMKQVIVHLIEALVNFKPIQINEPTPREPEEQPRPSPLATEEEQEDGVETQ